MAHRKKSNFDFPHQSRLLITTISNWFSLNVYKLCFVLCICVMHYNLLLCGIFLGGGCGFLKARAFRGGLPLPLHTNYFIPYSSYQLWYTLVSFYPNTNVGWSCLASKIYSGQGYYQTANVWLEHYWIWCSDDIQRESVKCRRSRNFSHSLFPCPIFIPFAFTLALWLSHSIKVTLPPCNWWPFNFIIN